MVDGFSVRADAVAAIRSLLDSATETHLAGRAVEASGPAPIEQRPGFGLAPPAAATLPSWHGELDRRWQAHHLALLRTHDQAVERLQATVRGYLDHDTAFEVAGLDGRPRDDGGPGLVPGDLELPAGGIGGDCDQAATLWRRRRDLAADTADRIADALRNLDGWTGPAAEAFTTWAETTLRRRWGDLDAAADAIGRALLDQPAPASPEEPHPPDRPPAAEGPAAEGPAPQVPTLTETPPPSGLGTPGPSSGTPPTIPAADTPLALPTGPAAAPRTVETPPPPAGGDAPGPAAGRTPESLPIGQIGASLAGPDPARVPTPHPNPSPPPGPSTGGSSTAVVASPVSPVPAEETAAPVASPPPMMPTAAMAGASALARSDITHHVIREITLPPPTTTPNPDPQRPTPPPPPGPGDPVLSPPHRFRPPDPPPPSTPPPISAPPPGRSDATPGPCLPHPARPGAPLPWRTRSHTRARHRKPRQTRPPMWVNLNPNQPPGAWVDLAAHRAVGIDGPGAAAVARTALRELALHTSTRLVITRDVLNTLTTDTDGAPHRDTSSPATGPDDGPLLIVDDPYDGLRHLTRDRGPAADMRRPQLLVLPAPASSEGRDELSAALTRLPGPAAALLLGLWPGTGLDLGPDHRVRTHRQPLGDDLTGRHLHPTSPTDLAHHLTPTDVPTDERTRQAEQSQTPEPDKSATLDAAEPTTPLTLSVLGPVELTYRAPAASSAEEQNAVVIEPIPRLARELLAWLAAHPHGATRDHLIDTLCPDTTSRRPETTLHSALSRLRRALIDTTDDDETANVITTGPRWTLNPAVVTVDHWTLLATSRGPARATDRRRAELRRVVDSYRDLYAVDIPGLWAHSIRESTRRRYLEIIHELVETELEHGDEQAALDLLERARRMEPRNEVIARAIITLHQRAGHTDAARAAYHLLTLELADIDAEPEVTTRQLIGTQSAEITPNRRHGRA